jgi:hypothetical protein
LRYRAPKRDRAAILYSRFVKRSGVDLVTGETPAVFAARAGSDSPIPADKINQITDTYLDARYGPTNLAALQKLESAISALR